MPAKAKPQAEKPTPREAQILAKMKAGLTRPQAEEVIDAQAAHDKANQPSNK